MHCFKRKPNFLEALHVHNGRSRLHVLFLGYPHLQQNPSSKIKDLYFQSQKQQEKSFNLQVS